MRFSVVPRVSVIQEDFREIHLMAGRIHVAIVGSIPIIVLPSKDQTGSQKNVKHWKSKLVEVDCVKEGE